MSNSKDSIAFTGEPKTVIPNKTAKGFGYVLEAGSLVLNSVWTAFKGESQLEMEDTLAQESDNFQFSEQEKEIRDITNNIFSGEDITSQHGNFFEEGEQQQQQILRQVENQEGENSLLPEPSIDETKNTLVIKNLPFKFQKSELDQILTDNSARPKNVRLMRDDGGKFTGIAFVRCPSKEEAGRLILNLNNMDVGGRLIQVEFKKKKKKGKLTSSTDTGMSSEDEGSRPVSIRSSLEVPKIQSGMNPQSGDRNFSYFSMPMPAPLPTEKRRNSVSAIQRPEESRFVRPEAESRRRSIATAEDATLNYPRSAFISRTANYFSSLGYDTPLRQSTALAASTTRMIQPIRQPTGPVPNSRGFSFEYQASRRALF